MFLKNLQITRNSLLSVILLLSQSTVVPNLYALDLKVDLPPDAGKEPVLYYNPIVNQQVDIKTKSLKKSEDSVNKKQQKVAQKTNASKNQLKDVTSLSENLGDVPPPPPSLVASKNNKDTEKNISTSQTNKNSATKTRSMREDPQIVKQALAKKQQESLESPFPMLPCIADNVKFWGKVYTLIDLNEAYLHDKNDLSRIYATVQLPQNKTQRNAILKNEREKYSKTLVSLSKKLHISPKKWSRDERKVARLFKKGQLTRKNLLEAKDNLRFQTGLKSQFEAGIQRSINYLPAVYPIVKQSGLPLDLALLPHVESSYNSRAGSKVGAMGLWQIMPATMRLFEGAAAVDKRTDPSFSTKTAMKILKADYEKIQDWPLTLTAYNHGVNGMLRAIDETGSRDLCRVIDHYESPSFRFASSNFYAQFLAARQAAMKRYAVLAKKGKGESSLVLRRTFFSTKGGTVK